MSPRRPACTSTAQPHLHASAAPAPFGPAHVAGDAPAREPRRLPGGQRPASSGAALLLVVLAVTACGLAAGQEPAAREAAALADPKLDGRAIVWEPRIEEYEALRLTVSDGERQIERTFPAGERPVLKLVGADGEPLPDGTYSWELRRIPKIDPSLRAAQDAARASGDPRLVAELEEKIRPRGPTRQDGVFTLAGGRPIDPGVPEKEPAIDPERLGDTLVEGDLVVRGRKAFVAEDPESPGESIHFVALEGPEAGTYYRGSARLEDGEAVVPLPDHFRAVTEPRGLTVQLTSVGGWSRLYVAEKSAARLVVRSAEGDPEAEFDFLVQGVRRGFADHRPRRPIDRD